MSNDDDTRVGVVSGLAAGILIIVLTAMALTAFQAQPESGAASADAATIVSPDAP